MDRAFEVARESGLIRSGEPLIVLISGGADSVCLLDVAVRLGARASALHVNYGLRPGADGDEDHCRRLCARLEVPLAVERAELTGRGNLQAEARDVRYAHAERLARQAEADYATAHTASDQAETVLYRLATSPGRRALLGMPARRGRHVRPLLRATSRDTRTYCEARGLEWRDDPSNEDPRFARSRIRHEVLPVLHDLNPAAERAIAETSALLQDEAAVLDRVVDDALEELGAAAVSLADLREREPGLARLAVRRLAEAALPGAALSSDDVDAILRLGVAGGTATLDLGSGLRAVAEYGVLRFSRDPEAGAPEPVTLRIPGTARFGEWEVVARTGAGPQEDSIEVEAVVSSEALGGTVLVRSWRPGDRMRPAGLGGTKSLQDLFTDRKVPRSLRRSLPVIEAGGEIVWVAGVAVADRFRPSETDRRTEQASAGLVALSARRLRR